MTGEEARKRDDAPLDEEASDRCFLSGFDGLYSSFLSPSGNSGSFWWASGTAAGERSLIAVGIEGVVSGASEDGAG